jgi:hypothetical protein
LKLSKKSAGEGKAAPAPVISKIPLPISDSPLVIDLPDGQKLVVGKMIQGSVIEVATWRGTGRPDSRTSRLMLGMSIGDVNPTPEEKAQAASAPAGSAPTIQSITDAPAEPKSQAQAWLDYLAAKYPALKFLKGKKIPQLKPPKGARSTSKSVKKSASLSTPVAEEQQAPSLKASKFGGIKARTSASVTARPAPVSTSAVTSFDSSADDDISAWLDQISEKARVRVEEQALLPDKTSKVASSKVKAPKAEVSLNDVFAKKAPAKQAPARRVNAAKKSASAPKKRK